MPQPSEVRQAYQNALPAIRAVKTYVSNTLIPYCDKNGFPYSGRIKDPESLAEKLESGRYEKWSELDDLYGCTIVVPTASQEDGVLKFLQGIFDQVDLRKRNSTMKAPEVFRFDSTRFIGRIRTQAGLDLTPGTETIAFEIQIPSAFEYAWAVVTHDLVYKSEDVDWRKARLVAQLKAAVEQIELIIASFQANVDFVAQSSYPEIDAKRALVLAFKELIDDGIISRELTPYRWSRFGDNIYDLVKSYSRNRSAISHNVSVLVDGVSARLRETGSARNLMSGSLQQVIIGCINSGHVRGANIRGFVVVNSPELRDFHNVREIPKPFEFDVLGHERPAADPTDLSEA